MAIETGGYYSIIPGYIMEIDHNILNGTDKIVYGKIASLTTAKGYCWASNKALAQGCGIAQANVTRSVNKLIKNDFIARKIVRNEQKQIIKRYLTLKQPTFSDGGPNNDEQSEVDTNLFDESTPPIKNDSTPGNKNVDTPPIKNVGERLKVIDKNNREMIQEQHPLAYYQIAFGKSASGLLNQKLTKLASMYGNALVNYSFYLANDNGNGYPYAKAILDSWINAGVTSIEQADQYMANRKKKNSKGQHKDNVTPIATKEKKLNEAVYNALLNNDMDVNKTISQFKLDGINLTNEQIGAIYRERA